MINKIFEAVIFDMDGVVIDTRKPIEAFWYELTGQYQVELNPHIMEQKIHGCPARQTVDALFTDISAAERERILQKCEEFETSMEYLPLEGIKPFLISLKEYQIPVALVTSSLPPKVAKVIDKLGLENIFDTIVTSDLVKKGKPDPACYLLAAQRLGKAPAQCIAFEDAVSGMKAVQAAGMFGIGVGSDIQEPLLKEAGANEVILNFSEVSLAGSGEGVILRINDYLSLQLNPAVFITR